jgi:nitrite reductase/ring-hydroxylating ferredoxin subunit/DMSO/TMAO reductase YedYZ heme-binding membrane subunit
VLALVFTYVLTFVRLAPMFTGDVKSADGAIVGARAFGTCAFLMLTVILCIGPLARLDTRFLPLLYNRRHFGVITFFVALTHIMFVINWYFNFSPTPRFEALLTSNTSYFQLLGFPFETLGLLALFALAVLATTSHDFWLRFLGPRLWKTLHYAIYFSYALIVGHIAFGSLQSQINPTFTIVTAGSALLVCGLHLAALNRERQSDHRAGGGDWTHVASVDEFANGLARIVRLANGDRVAVFRHENRLSAISNACAHQNGPLGEGRIIDGCVTCPWHGFQFRLADGCSPSPFTEKVPTYALKRVGDVIFVSSKKNPPGTYVEPLNMAAKE